MASTAGAAAASRSSRTPRTSSDRAVARSDQMAERDFDDGIDSPNSDNDVISDSDAISDSDDSLSKIAVYVDSKAEEARLRSALFGLLHPNTTNRGAYDMFQLAVMITLGFMLPYRLAFQKAPTSAMDIIFDLCLDLTVWVDMYLQMKMYIHDPLNGTLITDPKKIKSHYFKSWFAVDFLCVVPADQVLLVIGKTMVSNGAELVGEAVLFLSVKARMLRLLRLVRLVKIGDLLKIEYVIDQLFKLLKGLGVSKLQVSFYFRVIFLIALIVFVTHCSGPPGAIKCD